MASISIQFLALPEELFGFAKLCKSDFSLHVVAISYSPPQAEEMDCKGLSAAFAKNSHVEELCFTLSRPKLPVRDNVEFWDRNPELLRLQIGKRSEKGIDESQLSATAKNAGALAIWKKIAKRLKDMTTKGAIAVNPDTGDSGPANWYRFTEGAIKLYEAGVPLLTITGILLTPSASTRDRASPSMIHKSHVKRKNRS